MIIERIKESGDLFQQVVRLGTKNSKTLGHFPEGAFREYAKKGNIYCAIDENQVLGYLLFAAVQTKRTLRVIHLCVNINYRGTGVALALLNKLKFDHALNFKGISLSCRKDYVRANEFWKNYGFKPKDTVRSRSKTENYLIKWFYDFGNTDLFSILDVPYNKTTALLDANIIIKLREHKTSDKTGSKYLLADWLVDDVDYYYAQEIYNEFLRDGNSERATQSRKFLQNFYEAKFKPEENERILSKINQVIKGTSENDQSDKLQLSECITAGIDYFITTDTKILSHENYLFEEFGVRVLRPADFIILKDEDSNKSAYNSTRLSGVNYQYCRLKSGDIDKILSHFLRIKNGERRHQLRDLLTSLGGDIPNSHIKTVVDKSENLLAIWGAKNKDHYLEVCIIRTTTTKISATLFKQLAAEVIAYSKEKNFNKTLISERFLNPIEIETLDSLGFVKTDEGWMKLAIHKIGVSSEILRDKNIFNHLPTSRKKLIQNGAFAQDDLLKLEIERILWPVKFEDNKIPIYVIPIKPYWASQLFDHHLAADDLFGAKASLAWNRENVYYRSIMPIMEECPARILWYSSASDKFLRTRTSSIVATSYLDEVHIGSAKDLFRKFKHYGIYEWSHILDLAKGDPSSEIKALKFSDTEVFDKPIPLKVIHEILRVNGQSKNTFASPVKISVAAFLNIYSIGTELSHE